MNKTVVFSTEFDSENGQAVVTRRVVRHVLPEIGESVQCVYPSGSGVSSIAAWAAACFKLLWSLARSRNGVVYVVCSRTTSGFIRDLPGLVPALLHKRVVVHCHGSDFIDFLTTRSLSGVARFVYRRCEVVFPCRKLKEQAEDKVKTAHLCENFFGAVDTATEQQAQDPSRLLVVWNSNIMASKGFFDVAKAIDTLVRAGRPVEFLCYGKILGDHELPEDAVRQEMSKYEGCAWFSYLGLVTHTDAVRALQNADVVALPSRYSSEMQPLAIIEAMCAAKRVIVSDRASLRATVGDYPADFVPTNDASAVADCIATLCDEKMSDPELFAAKNLAPAARSKVRFSTGRFDAGMKDILLSREK